MRRFRLSKADSQKVLAAIELFTAGSRTDGGSSYLQRRLGHFASLSEPLRQSGKPPDARWNVWQEGMVGQSVAEIITAWGTVADGLEDIQVELPEIEIPAADSSVGAT